MPGRLLRPGRSSTRPGAEGSLDLGQHRFSDLPRLADLGSRVPLRYPAAEIPRGDGLGRPLDVGERPQAGPDQADADDRQPEDDAKAHDQVNPGQLPIVL